MAGIGFVLKKLVNRDDLISAARAYTHSALISCGPWVFTIFALTIVFTFSGSNVRTEGYLNFQAALFYNFAFSLIFSAPIHMVATRYIADSIYKHDVTNIPSSLLVCFLLVVLTQLAPVAWFYFYYTQLPLLFQLLAFLNFFLLSSVWTINVYLTALKNYGATTRAFAIGMLIIFVFMMFLVKGYNEIGVLLGLNIGLVFIVFSLIGEVLAEYNYVFSNIREFWLYFRKFYDLALAGTFYSLGVWADKIVMAFAPESTLLKSGMHVYFEYNKAFFIAYIVMIPAIAMFILSVETNFFGHYRRFYKDILDGVPYSRIKINHHAIIQNLRISGRDMAIMQGCVCFVVMALAHKIFAFLHLGLAQMSMFRFAVFGSYLHVLALFELIILSYFECRRAALWIQLVFFLTNAVFTYITMLLGFEYYGYGYFLSALVTFLLATAALHHYVTQLPYCDFILNNIIYRRPN